MKKAFIYMAMAAVFAVSCESAETDSPVQYGKLSVSLTGEEPEITVSTKAGEQTEEQTEELTAAQAAGYNVAVYADEECSGKPVIGPLPYSEFGTQTIAAGTYYVSAESCTPSEAETGNGQKRFCGVSQGVAVTASAAAADTAKVECKVSNALVTVSFDQETVYNGEDCRFTDLKVTLTSGSKTADVSASKTDVKHWFNPCTLEYKITGTFIATGKVVSYEKNYTLEAKDNIKLLVKVNLDSGVLVPSFTFDDEITEAEDITSGFNPYE